MVSVQFGYVSSPQLIPITALKSVLLLPHGLPVQGLGCLSTRASASPFGNTLFVTTTLFNISFPSPIVIVGSPTSLVKGKGIAMGNGGPSGSLTGFPEGGREHQNLHQHNSTFTRGHIFQTGPYVFPQVACVFSAQNCTGFSQPTYHPQSLSN